MIPVKLTQSDTFPAPHVETSSVAHLENANCQTEESEIAANFQSAYAKQFLPHTNCIQTLMSNVKRKERTFCICKNSFKVISGNASKFP